MTGVDGSTPGGPPEDLIAELVRQEHAATAMAADGIRDLLAGIDVQTRIIERHEEAIADAEGVRTTAQAALTERTRATFQTRSNRLHQLAAHFGESAGNRKVFEAAAFFSRDEISHAGEALDEARRIEHGAGILALAEPDEPVLTTSLVSGGESGRLYGGRLTDRFELKLRDQTAEGQTPRPVAVAIATIRPVDDPAIIAVMEVGLGGLSHGTLSELGVHIGRRAIGRLVRVVLTGQSGELRLQIWDALKGAGLTLADLGIERPEPTEAT